MDNTLTQAILDMAPIKINDKDKMLYICMRLCNSELSLEDIVAYCSGKSININIVDARRIFVFKHTINEHIYEDSGYNTCMELFHAMTLGTHGSMGVPRQKVHENPESIEKFYIATHDPNTFEKAARLFTVITSDNMVMEYSASFGYLMLNHAMVKGGYDKFIPMNEAVFNNLASNSNKDYMVRVNEILEILKNYYPAIK